MPRSRHLRRGIYLLPTMFTVANLFCGYSAIVQASRGNVEQAALLIILAGLLDGMDGRIARLTGTTSDFGLQFDSLADMISFGVAPALLAYHWALQSLGRFGWILAFIYVVCAAMRLARFNIQNPQGGGREDKRYFAGLPSPAAAGSLASVAFAVPLPSDLRWAVTVQALWVSLLGLLMIGRFRYRSFREFDLRNRRSYIFVLPMTAMLIAVVAQPKLALVMFAAFYLASAPAAYAWGLMRRRVPRDVPDVVEVVDEPALR